MVNPIRDTIIANATEKIADIIGRLEWKEDRSSVMMKLSEMFCDTCGGRHDDDAIKLSRHIRCDCVVWADDD